MQPIAGQQARHPFEAQRPGTTTELGAQQPDVLEQRRQPRVAVARGRVDEGEHGAALGIDSFQRSLEPPVERLRVTADIVDDRDARTGRQPHHDTAGR